MSYRLIWTKKSTSGLFLFFILLLFANFAAAQSSDGSSLDNEAIAEKEKELSVIQNKIDALNLARKKYDLEKNNLVQTLKIIDANIDVTRLELDKTAVSIQVAHEKIKKNIRDLAASQMQTDRLRGELEDILREMSVFDRSTIWETLLGNGSFATYLQTDDAYRSMQRRMMGLMLVVHDAKKVLEQQKDDLQRKEDELTQLRVLQESQNISLKSEQDKKNEALSQTVAQQKKVSSLIAEAEQAQSEIKQQIFSLKNSGINMSLNDAVKIAKYAEQITGVRAALLLGVLKIESNLGNNVGSGRYPDDVHPAHRDAFLRVARKLGIDPTKAQVSAKPKSYPGWGGAMGPGQIMPGIWESIESSITELTGKRSPSPYNLEDAFVGTAIILRNSGAANGNEFEAVNRYFAGGNWQRFTWYGNRVLEVAKQYEAIN